MALECSVSMNNEVRLRAAFALHGLPLAYFLGEIPKS